MYIHIKMQYLSLADTKLMLVVIHKSLIFATISSSHTRYFDAWFSGPHSNTCTVLCINTTIDHTCSILGGTRQTCNLLLLTLLAVHERIIISATGYSDQCFLPVKSCKTSHVRQST